MAGNGEVKLKLLLVDDEEDFLRPLSLRLGKRGFEVSQATDGEQALEYLASHPADVVVLDLTMPGMEGLATLLRLKELHPMIEVILLSGRTGLDDALTGMAEGAFDYMLKPADIQLLTYKLQDAGMRKRLREKSAAAGKEGET